MKINPPESLSNDAVVKVVSWPRPTTNISTSSSKLGITDPSIISNKVNDCTPIITTDSQIPTRPPQAESPLRKEHLVVDAGAFIRLKQLHEFGFELIHVTPGVAREIRDHAARQNLGMLCDIPMISTPEDKDIEFVKRFAQQTGDLGFLSENDIEVIALTYMLQRGTGDITHLKSRPADNAETIKEGEQKFMFTWGTGVEWKNEENTEETDISDDDGEWIGEENIEEFQNIQGAGLDPDIVVETLDQSLRRYRVACLSTDYSVQNVLVQLGLSVLSIDGMRIKTTKKWALLCRACRKVMSDTTKFFCGHCGNNMLTKVAVSLGVDGRMIVELPKYKPNIKQRVLSIPTARGNNRNLIQCEDEIFIGGRDRLLRRHQKLLAKEKLIKDPFNPNNAYELKGWHHRNNKEDTTKIRQVVVGQRTPNRGKHKRKNN